MMLTAHSFPSIVPIHSTILDSLVVRISACHVEGPGSIPGRGVKLFFFFLKRLPVMRQAHPIIFSLLTALRARVAQSVER